MFRGFEFAVTRDVMRPCEASSILVDAALDLIAGGASGGAPGAPAMLEEQVVLDAGTGCGCLLVAILRETRRGSCRGVGLDVCAAALEVAMANAARARVESRCCFVECDFGNMSVGAVGAEVDVLIANPPYHVKSRFDQGSYIHGREPCILSRKPCIYYFLCMFLFFLSFFLFSRIGESS